MYAYFGFHSFANSAKIIIHLYTSYIARYFHSPFLKLSSHAYECNFSCKSAPSRFLICLGVVRFTMKTFDIRGNDILLINPITKGDKNHIAARLHVDCY